MKKMWINKIKSNKYLILALLVGAILRLGFIIFGAEIYFNRPNIFIDGDTWAWQNCIENLINNGTYTVGGDKGQFSRMPGYAFFMGVFFLLTGQNWDVAVVIIAWFQTFVDVLNIYLIFLLSELIFKNKRISTIAAFIYGIYPFIIVWNPVCYAETWSIFLMILSLVFFFQSEEENSQKKLIISGITIALCSLTRPQLIPLFPILILILFITNKNQFRILIRKSVMFGFSFSILFGIWPVRNFLNHDRLIITKNAEGFANWQDDVIAFMQYTYAVKAEWDPQYTSIVKNEKTTYPKIAYPSRADSLKLEKAIYLSKNCGGGFSRKKGYWKEIVNEGNCNAEIKKLFNELREKQIRVNPLNYYLIVPFKNFKKAIFKSQLYDNKSTYRKIGSLLFYWRTILILIGLIGAFTLVKKNQISYITLLYFGSVYITLCFGTSPFMRNIEIRYFLPADVLLIFPASYFIAELLNKKLKTKN